MWGGVGVGGLRLSASIRWSRPLRARGEGEGSPPFLALSSRLGGVSQRLKGAPRPGERKREVALLTPLLAGALKERLFPSSATGLGEFAPRGGGKGLGKKENKRAVGLAGEDETGSQALGTTRALVNRPRGVVVVVVGGGGPRVVGEEGRGRSEAKQTWSCPLPTLSLLHSFQKRTVGLPPPPLFPSASPRLEFLKPPPKN